MTFRTWLARKLCPDLALDADAAWRMRCELQTDVQWLHEFPDVRDELQRLISLDRSYTGKPVHPQVVPFSYDIGSFREALRRRRDSRAA
jgi:hypothetical protein